LIHRIDGNHTTYPPRAISELQRFETTADADVNHRVARPELAEIHGGTAAIVHRQHAPGNPQVGKPPSRRSCATEVSFRIPRRLGIYVLHSFEVDAHDCVFS